MDKDMMFCELCGQNHLQGEHCSECVVRPGEIETIIISELWPDDIDLKDFMGLPFNVNDKNDEI